MGKVINISEDSIRNVYTAYKEMINTELNIQVPDGDVKNFYINKNTKLKKAHEHIYGSGGLIENVTKRIAQTMMSIKDLDSTIDVDIYRSAGVIGGAGKEAIISKYKRFTMKEMNADDWKKLAKSGTGKVKGNYYYITKNGYTYQYNMKTKQLRIFKGTNKNITNTKGLGNAGTVRVTYYYPSGAKDLSKVNTHTFIHTSAKFNNKKFQGLSIVGVVDRDYSLKSTDLKTIGHTTKFMNAFAKTKKGCKNYVGGGSRFGTMATYLALQHVDTKNKTSLYTDVIGFNSGLGIKSNDRKKWLAETERNARPLTPSELKKGQGYLNYHFLENSADPNDKAAKDATNCINKKCYNGSGKKAYYTKVKPGKSSDLTGYDQSDRANNKRKEHSDYDQLMYDVIYSGKYDGNKFNK